MMVAATILGACGNRDGTASQVADAIAISSPSGTVGVTGTMQFSAVVTDDHGNVLTVRPVWSVVAGGGTIDSTGLFTAGDTAGVFENTVVATIGAVTSSSTVTVTAGPLATIMLTPATTVLAITATQQYVAIGKDAHGNVVAITPTWGASEAGSISNTGLFTAGTTVGSFLNSISATSGAISATASVEVTIGALATITVTPATITLAIGATQQFTAVGHDAGNNVVALVPTWSVASGGGTISGTGLLTAGTIAGTFTNSVTATSGSISGTSSVVVSTGALATITVSPSSPSLAIGATQQYTAVGKDVNNNIVPITPAWHVTASGGTINSVTGLFTAGTVAGTFTNTVTAQVGVCASAIYGHANAIVSAGALATITIAPATVTLASGATQQYTASGTDANGNAVPVTPTWSVAAGGGTISGTGVFTAGSTAGTFTNTVHVAGGASNAIVATATVTVTTVLPVVTITVKPDVPLVYSGNTQQYTAVGTDINGTVVAITPVWSVSSGAGTIDADGLFTAGTVDGVYPNSIIATVGAVVGKASVVVDCGC